MPLYHASPRRSEGFFPAVIDCCFIPVSSYLQVSVDEMKDGVAALFQTVDINNDGLVSPAFFFLLWLTT